MDGEALGESGKRAKSTKQFGSKFDSTTCTDKVYSLSLERKVFLLSLPHELHELVR